MGTNCQIAAAVVGAGVYVTALLLPAFRGPLRGSESTYPGYNAVQMAWRAWTAPPPFDWDTSRAVLGAGAAANSAIWSAGLLLAAGFRRLALGFAGLALAGQVATGYWFWSLVADCSGFWCWVACPLWLGTAACFCRAVRPSAELGSQDLEAASGRKNWGPSTPSS